MPPFIEGTLLNSGWAWMQLQEKVGYTVYILKMLDT